MEKNIDKSMKKRWIVSFKGLVIVSSASILFVLCYFDEFEEIAYGYILIMVFLVAIFGSILQIRKIRRWNDDDSHREMKIKIIKVFLTLYILFFAISLVSIIMTESYSFSTCSLVLSFLLGIVHHVIQFRFYKGSRLED